MQAAYNDGRDINNFLKASCQFETLLLHDKTAEEVVKALQSLQTFAKKTCSMEKAAFFIYYSGHGQLVNGVTKGFTTTGEPIDLEDLIRRIANYANTYVVGFLDCCRETPAVETKGSMEVEEKTSGQICIIHAVGPKKKAVAVATTSGRSYVTDQFLNVMHTTKQTFPSCISKWAKRHPTLELLDKCQFDFQLKVQTGKFSSVLVTKC